MVLKMVLQEPYKLLIFHGHLKDSKKALKVIPLLGIFFEILEIVYEKPFSHSNVLTTIINLKFNNSQTIVSICKIY